MSRSPMACWRGRQPMFYANSVLRFLIFIMIVVSAMPFTPLHAQVPGECTKPAAGRPSELGCYLLIETPIGQLSRQSAYWHIVRYESAAAAAADQRPHQTLVDSLGSHWLFAIARRD